MKLGWLLIFVGALSTILTATVGRSPNLSQHISLFMSVFSFAMGVVLEVKNRKESYLALSENRLQHVQILDEVNKYESLLKTSEKRLSKSEKANTKLLKLMEMVSFKLRKEALSKDTILRRLKRPANALILYKTEEMDLKNSKEKPLRDVILPSLGFKYIKGNRGLYVLPPSLLPPFRRRGELEDWISENILAAIPSNFRYIISLISLVDLRFTLSVKKDKLSKRYKTVLEELDANDLISADRGINYLQNKLKISVEDLIKIPNIYFLSDKTSLKASQKQILFEKNDLIIAELEADLGSGFTTFDFAEVDEKTLKQVIGKHVPITSKDAKRIKQNAKFWSDFLLSKP